MIAAHSGFITKVYNPLLFLCPLFNCGDSLFNHCAASISIDVFKDKDSLRLISNTAYVGDKSDPQSLSTFKSVAAGDYCVKVKAKDGTKETTILDIPVVKLGEGKVTTLYLSGLTKGTGTTKIGLQVSQHK